MPGEPPRERFDRTIAEILGIRPRYDKMLARRLGWGIAAMKAAQDSGRTCSLGQCGVLVTA